MGFKGDPELSAMVAGFRAWTAQADAMAEKYSAPPSPVDFASAKKSIRDTALVDNLEKFAKSFSPPAEIYEWSEEDKAAKAQLIEDTKKEILFMRNNRTTRDVSTSDMKEIYPDIAEEVEKEIENREWFKDTLNK